MRKRTKKEWVEVCHKINAGPIGGGSRGGLYDNAIALCDMLREFNLWQGGDRILEIGSGNGRFAMGLADTDDISFVGVEIIKNCVDYCNDAFSIYPNISFIHVDVMNPRYWSVGKIKPSEVVYPLESGSFDLVAMLSVMTHIDEATVEQNVSESLRLLKPGGKFFTTWFKSPPNKITDDPARTVYDQSDILGFLSKFDVINATGGDTDDPHDQWYITCKKPTDGSNNED